MGIYIFEATVLYDVLDARPDDHDFGKAIIPRAIHARRVFAYPFTGYWNDIGTVRSFFETNIMLAQPHPAFNLYDPKLPLYTDARDASARQGEPLAHREHAHRRSAA